MRWMIRCTVWVTIAAVITASKEDDTRPKRDITFIKNFITSKLFGGEALQAPAAPNYRLFRIPGFDNILVKAVPKGYVVVRDTPLAVEHKLEDVHPALALVSSYLGTNSFNETNTALERVKSLLESGVLNAQEEDADIPYHVPIDIPPMTETVQIIAKNDVSEVPSIQYSVPIPYMPLVHKLYKPVQIPIPNLAYPTKYSYKQLHHDGVTSYNSDDAKNVVVTESKVPVQLPHYLSGRIQEVLALGINRVALTPMSVVQPLPYKSYNIPANPYVPMRFSPAFLGDNYSHHLDPDGIVTSTGVNYFPTNYSYKHLHQDGSTSTYTGPGERIETPGFQHPHVVNIYEPTKVLATPYIPMKAAPALLPTGYSYKHFHNDGTVTSYSDVGLVKKFNERPVEKEIKRPNPHPAFFANRIENVAATAHNLLSTAAPKETVYVPPISVYQEATPFIPTNITPAVVPTNYSYKHIHNDGTVTKYSGADVVEKVGRPAVVLEEVRRPILPPSYFINGNKNTATAYKLPPFIGEPTYGPQVSVYQGPAPFVATPFTPEVGPIGYSYKHVHNDGTVTGYSDAGIVEERPGILVQEVKRPIPLSRFFANRIETVAATAHKLPQAIIEQPAVYYPALPVHQDAYPVLLEHLRGSFPKPLNPHFNDEVKINFTGHNGNVQTGYSYQTVRQEGSSTSHFNSKPVQENNENYKEKKIESQDKSNTETYGKVDTQSGEFSYNTVYSDGSITSPVLVPKPIISQYSYKQINHHMPNVPFTVVQVGDGPEMLEQLKAQLDRDKVTKGKSENSAPEINKDYIFVPPFTATGSNLNGKAVDLKPATPSNSSEDNLDAYKDAFYTTEAAVSSSAISLSANPIVVPEDRVYSYKQDKAGSSITVVADKTNKVSVVEENKIDNLESHRGDIPDISF